MSRASITDVREQMALFDRLIDDDGVSKVVDLGAKFFSTFFSECGNNDTDNRSVIRWVQTEV